MNSPHLLVIGGTGFIGHHLLKLKQLEGWKKTSVSLNKPLKKRLVDGVNYLHFDITKQILLKKHLDEDFDYVVNLGGYINHQLFQQGGGKLIDTHFTALQNLLAVLPRRKLKRFVHIGSSDEYGYAPAPQREDLREIAISPYSLAKVASTHFLQMLHRTENFPAVILRLFLTYGPGQNNRRFLPQIIRGCLKDEAFPSSEGEQIRDFCYIEDISRAILCALTESNVEGEVFNAASGQPISIRTMITKICNLTGTGVAQYGKVPYRPGENMNLYADINKIKKSLGWNPQINLEEGLQKTIRWYKVNG